MVYSVHGLEDGLSLQDL